MSSNTSKIVLGGLALAAVGAVGYAAYFDHKRRTDREFRRNLKKNAAAAAQKAAKEAEKEAAPAAAAPAAASALPNPADIEVPTDPEKREAFFMHNLQTGEMLMQRGASAFPEAAHHLYLAIKAYPQPMEMMVMLEKSVPPALFNLIMESVAQDVKSKQEKYFDLYPNPEWGIKIDEMGETQNAYGKTILRRGLRAKKAFSAGSKIYTETPLLSAVHPAHVATHCQNCMKAVDEAKTACPDCPAVYCSTACSTIDSDIHGRLCFKSDDMKALLDWCTEHGVVYPLAMARFLSRLMATSGGEDDFSAWDHMERLQYLALQPAEADEKEHKLICQAVGGSTPGFDQFFTPERFLTLKGRCLYNGYEVATGEGAATAATEAEIETAIASTPSGPGPFTPKDPLGIRYRCGSDVASVGMGLYHISSYLSNATAPNAMMVFDEKTSAMSLVAIKDVAEEEEVTVSFVPTTWSLADRRHILKLNYRALCKDESEAAETIDVIADFAEKLELEAERLEKEARVEPKMKSASASETETPEVAETEETTA